MSLEVIFILFFLYHFVFPNLYFTRSWAGKLPQQAAGVFQGLESPRQEAKPSGLFLDTQAHPEEENNATWTRKYTHTQTITYSLRFQSFRPDGSWVGTQAASMVATEAEGPLPAPQASSWSPDGSPVATAGPLPRAPCQSDQSL